MVGQTANLLHDLYAVLGRPIRKRPDLSAALVAEVSHRESNI